MLALLGAHAAAYRALKRTLGAEVRVGIAHHLASIAADRPWHPLDRLAARVARHGLNRAFLDALVTGRLKYFPDLPLADRVPEAAGTLDFVGVNYYSRLFVRLEASARTIGSTGVEMEALTAVQVGLLTIYDMLKAADPAMTIGPVRLLRKSGGRHGDWQRVAEG